MRKIGFLFVLSNVIWFAACGSSNGGGSTSTVTAVTASCSPSTVNSGGTSNCTAAVSGTGSFNTGVTWSATAGSVTSSGVFTAPTVSTQTIVTITATSTQDTSKSGSATVTVNPATAANNVAPLIVDAGPQGGELNLAFVTVTVCVPGTNQCQDIDHVQLDTGSEGLRLLSGVLTNITLPADGSLAECLVFADGYVWGPVATADVTIAGEFAQSVPVHVLIPSSSSPPVPGTCSSQNPPGGNGDEGGSISDLGAKGILGVGAFQTDCGGYCEQFGAGCGGSGQPCVYYQCSGSSCSGVNVALNQQVPNPVIDCPADNNGVLVQLPAVPNGGSSNVAGSLIFGIGTQSNNSLNLAANVYQIPDVGNNAGNFITTFNGTSYPQSFIDSGSNGLFFLDSNTTGIPTCSGQNSPWYCPNTSPDNLTASNQGQNNNGSPVGNSVAVNFAIENANNLFNTNNTAFSTLGGPNPGAFDWGLPFFFGRSVFTAIDGAPVSGCGTGCAGPFFAY